MWQTIFISALIIIALGCVIALFLIQSEPGPSAQHKPREGGTEYMPAIMSPKVPPKKKDKK